MMDLLELLPRILAEDREQIDIYIANATRAYKIQQDSRGITRLLSGIILRTYSNKIARQILKLVNEGVVRAENAY